MADYPLDYDVMNQDDATTAGNSDEFYPLSSVKIVICDVYEMMDICKKADGILRRAKQILGTNSYA